MTESHAAAEPHIVAKQMNQDAMSAVLRDYEARFPERPMVVFLRRAPCCEPGRWAAYRHPDLSEWVWWEIVRRDPHKFAWWAISVLGRLLGFDPQHCSDLADRIVAADLIEADSDEAFQRFLHALSKFT